MQRRHMASLRRILSSTAMISSTQCHTHGPSRTIHNLLRSQIPMLSNLLRSPIQTPNSPHHSSQTLTLHSSLILPSNSLRLTQHSNSLRLTQQSSSHQQPLLLLRLLLRLQVQRMLPMSDSPINYKERSRKRKKGLRLAKLQSRPRLRLRQRRSLPKTHLLQPKLPSRRPLMRRRQSVRLLETVRRRTTRKVKVSLKKGRKETKKKKRRMLKKRRPS